jgi:hypothetical protein
MPAVADMPLTSGPHTSAENNLKETSRPVSRARKIDRNGSKIRENLWGYNIQFGTLFIIDTSPNSPRILNYSNDSKSNLI